MKIENRLVYIADDGQEFDSEDACKQHEKAIKFCRVVEEHISRFASGYYDSDVKEDIARAVSDTFPALIEKYNNL